MGPLSRMIRLASVLVALILACAPAVRPVAAQETGPVRVTSDVRYEFIGRWDAERLNRVLQVDMPKFADLAVTYTPARNAVRLYRVTYASVIPERGNRPIEATGLVAIPDTEGTAFPMVSYQHGTVYGKQEVPSFPEQSPETQATVAQFAGQGYVVVAADYFGMGTSKEPEGYMVKASHQQATYDMLRAARAVLDHMKLSSTGLFLAGWSQGGFVTMALLEKLEKQGMAVRGTATASAPVDMFVAMNGFLNFPRKIDATWTTLVFILPAFAFEKYYGIPGLARAVINDAQYETARKIYERELTDPAAMPTDLRVLIRADYFNPKFFAESAFGRLAAGTTAYRWVIGSPVRNYYGETDEVISTGLGQLVMTYQRAMGAGNTQVEAVSTGATTHRGTFARALPQWKAWFDGL